MLDGFALMEVVVKKDHKPKVPGGFDLVKSPEAGGDGNGGQQ